MTVDTASKICSNCKKQYDISRPLPLCPECSSKLSGYEFLLNKSKDSESYSPHPADDGVKINYPI